MIQLLNAPFNMTRATWLKNMKDFEQALEVPVRDIRIVGEVFGPFSIVLEPRIGERSLITKYVCEVQA